MNLDELSIISRQKRPTGSDREDLFGSGPHLCRRSDESDVSANGQKNTAASDPISGCW